MHTINIVNLNNNEKITYSFALIKGYILNSETNNCLKSCDIVTLENRKSNLYLQCSLKNNCFKFLVELTEGFNDFLINFCCVTITFTLEYLDKNTNFIVTPLYIICSGHNGKFQAPLTENNSIESACKRITTGIKLLQCVIAEKLFEQNLERHTFKLDSNCHVFYSKLHYNKARQMQQKQLWDYFAREIINSDLNFKKRKFLALLSCTKYQVNAEYQKTEHKDVLKQTQAHVALGAGGLALFGTGCLYTWPENVFEVISRFLNTTRVDSDNFMDDSSYRGTWGSCFSTTLGGVLHELCHSFDLGHTIDGIMGRGFDNIYKVFTLDNQAEKTYKNSDDTYFTKSCAVLLRYHKWINIPQQSKSILKYDSSTGVVKSTAGIRVVEIRSENNGMVLESWIFTSKVLKFSFRIPEEAFNKYEEKIAVIIEDSKGNIVKENISVI